jgi:hypothetical protein
MLIGIKASMIFNDPQSLVTFKSCVSYGLDYKVVI